jgi:hypothetical protein
MFLNHLRNPFLNAEISDTNFGKLASTHIERLKASNTSNRYDGLITLTEPLYQAFVGTLFTGSGSSSTKESKTMRTNETLNALKAYIGRKEGVIADKFPRNTPVYQEFFPQGLKEYRNASKKNLQVVAERFVKAAQTHSTVLGKDIAKEAQSLMESYVNCRTEQLQAIGSLKGISSESKSKRKALAVQLYKNLLHILLENAEQTGQAKDYFDISFLKKARKEEKPLAA